MKTITKRFLFLMLLLPVFMFGQTAITGTVTEQGTSIPLPGVNVVVKGTTNGTATDFDGNFALQVKDGDILVFSYVGYTQQELTYSGQNTINIALAEDAAQLDEIVVIGYGSTTKKDATGSVESITSDDFTKGNIVTADNLISGRVSGVTVNEWSSWFWNSN